MILNKTGLSESEFIQATRHRTLYLICIATAITAAISTTALLPVSLTMSPIIPVGGYFASLLFLTPLLLYRLKGSLKLSSLLLIAIIYTDVLFMVIYSDGVLSHNVIYLIGLPIMAVILINQQTALIIAAILIVTYAYFGLTVMHPRYAFAMSIATAALTVILCVAYQGIAKLNQHYLEAKQAAIKANKFKSRYLATMSHELRTPLNGVIGMCQMLETTSLNDKQQKYTGQIQASGTALLDIINDVLDLAKIESGSTELSLADVDLKQVVQQAINAVEGTAVHKNINLSAKFGDMSANLYLGDAKQIRQVLINLVGNAIKFTEEGRVQVALSQKDNGDYLFEVSDTGPGISEADLAQLFGRFQQIDNEATRQEMGSGLGLSISKEIIDLMGGEIGVRSEVGVGSTFWFTLPAHSALKA